jgi:aspartate kinase
MKVMKFGGSTIKTPDLMKKVMAVIRDEKDDKVVVISALFGQTNEIREYLKTIKTESEDINSFISHVLKRHVDMADNVISDDRILMDVKNNIKRIILKLERLLYGVAYTEELTPKTQDLILSSAERMSVYLLEGLLLDAGISAKAYEADKIGIITDGKFLYATANLGKCEQNLKENIMPQVNKGIVPVITGFFGPKSAVAASFAFSILGTIFWIIPYFSVYKTNIVLQFFVVLLVLSWNTICLLLCISIYKRYTKSKARKLHKGFILTFTLIMTLSFLGGIL